MVRRWGVRCDNCGLDKSMCLGHGEEVQDAGQVNRGQAWLNAVQDAGQESRVKAKLLLDAVQELKTATPELFDGPNLMVDIALNMLETKLARRACKVVSVKSEEAA